MSEKNKRRTDSKQVQSKYLEQKTENTEKILFVLQLWYDPNQVFQAWDSFIRAASTLTSSDLYR